MTPQKRNNMLIVVLLVALMFLALYAFQKSNQYTNLQKGFKEEKIDLKNDLDEMIKDYTDVVVRKKHLSKRLRKELAKMEILRDSIKNLKVDNYNLIRKYRRKIVSLERENRDLFIRIDSLNNANQLLAQKNIIANEILIQKETINSALKEKNKVLEVKQQDLEKKIAIGGIIKTSPIKAIAMKERSSGKLTSTSRSSRADAFRINFDLLKNEVTTPGKKLVYIQITNEAKKVIAPKGVADIKNGDKIQYSDVVEVSYNNNQLSLVSLVLVNRDDINKGKYTISAFVDGNYSATTTVKLR